MNTPMASGFQSGSGVDPATLKLVLLSLCAGVVLLVALWIVARLIDGYRHEDLSAPEVVTASCFGVMAVCLVIGFMVLL